MRILVAFSVLLSLLLLTKKSYAGCAEYKIVDHGDSIEAVCVGKSPSDVEKKTASNMYSEQEEKEKRYAVIDCNANVQDIYSGMTETEREYRKKQVAECNNLTDDLNMYIKSEYVAKSKEAYYAERKYSEAEEKDIRYSLNQCRSNLPNANSYSSKFDLQYAKKQEAMCAKLAVDLNIYIDLKTRKSISRADRYSNSGSSVGASEMQGQLDAQRIAQQAETQRQQAEIQRIQQQQRFDNIWKK